MHSLGTISLPCFQGLSSYWPRHVIAKGLSFVFVSLMADGRIEVASDLNVNEPSLCG